MNYGIRSHPFFRMSCFMYMNLKDIVMVEDMFNKRKVEFIIFSTVKQYIV